MTLTGFLSTEMYGGLLAAADAVLVLTTLDHTMLRGAYEAIYQGTPVIVSDWPLLREAFPTGAVHVDNTADGIAEGVRLVEKFHEDFRAGARQLRAEKSARWEQTRQQILSRIGADARPQASGLRMHEELPNTSRGTH